MRKSTLFVFSIIGWFFIFLLIFETIIGNSAWATVAVTGILVIITAYYAITTENLLRVNSQYAFTTEKILDVNRETLELLNRELELHTIERKSAKVEEIVRRILVPFELVVKSHKQKIKDKRNVWLNDYTLKNVKIFRLFYDEQFSTTLEYIKSKFEDIKINENYEEPVFRGHIKKIFECIKDYDTQECEYIHFISTDAPPIFRNIMRPFLEEKGISGVPCFITFIFLIKGRLDPKTDLNPFNIGEEFLINFSTLPDEMYKKYPEFQEFIKKKTEYDEILIEKLESLDKELDQMLSSWMNIYHIPIPPAIQYPQ
jgi:hypothetical protein